MIERLMKLAVILLPRFIAARIWLAAEDRGVSLGRWAPHIFGRMLGGCTTWKRIK